MEFQSRFVSENEVKIIDLGNDEWVKIPARLSFGFSSRFEELVQGKEGKETEKISKLLIQVIKEWNIKLPDGSVPPVSVEMIEQLDVETLKVIMAEVKTLMGVSKKEPAALIG